MGGEGDYSCYSQWRGEGESYAEEVRRILLKEAFMTVYNASDAPPSALVSYISIHLAEDIATIYNKKATGRV